MNGRLIHHPNLLADRRRAFAWLGLLALLLSLLAPQLSVESTAAAQVLTSNQEACDDGFELNERTGECEREPQTVPGQIVTECPDGTVLERETGACIPVPETETPVVTEPATEAPAMETSTEAATEPPAPLGYAQAIKRACPDGFVPNEATTITELQDTCLDPIEGVLFHLTVGDIAHASVATDATGLSQLGSAPVGDIGLVEEIPAGYGEPIVYCAEGYAFGPFEHTYTEDDRQPVLNGNAIAWTLPADTLLQCFFYNIVAGGPGDITTQSETEALKQPFEVVAHKRLCPHDYVHPAQIVPTLEEMQAECSEIGEDIEFTIDHADGTETLPTVDGTVTFNDVPAGQLSLTEDIPDGYATPAWYCSFAPYGGGPPSPESPTIAANGEYHGVLEHPEGGVYTCWVFNIPLPHLSSITIHKLTCPAGYEIDPVVSDPLDDCTETADGITFTIDDGDPPASDQTRVTGDDGPGTVIFTGLEAGTHTVTEVVPEGFTYSTGWCASLGQIQAFDDPPRLVFQLPAATHWSCYFLNIPDHDPTVTAIKWLCPEGLEPGSEDLQDWLDTCTDHPAPIDFTLTDADGDITQSVDGSAIWNGVAPGDIAITEHTPAIFLEPYVFCSYTALNDGAAVASGPQTMPVSGSTVTMEMPFDDFDLVCHFFNVPEEPEDNKVEIHKWQCPEGTITEQSLAWYQDLCSAAHNGVEFTITSSIGIAVQETAGGTASFPGLPASIVGIQETIPDGFGPPVVFCWTDGPEGWQPYDAPTGYWEFDFQNDGVSTNLLKCYVFNIPGEPPSITIHKWTCPAGYDLFAAGADPKTDCTEATNGIQFQLGPTGGAALAEMQTTGDVIDGGVVFSGLAPGVYKAVEIVPEGVASVFVLECTGHIMGALQPYPLQMGNVLDGIALDAGEHLTCHWYNVPEVEGGTLTVIKSICATETFVSDLDCEIYEHGATFDLRYWTGTWDLVGTETTDGSGRIQWTDLPDGEYWFEEHDGAWCHIASEQLYEDGPWVLVGNDQETVVHIYNCDPGWVPDDTPEKYPNTGVPPADAAPLMALLGMPMSRRRLVALAAGALNLTTPRAAAMRNTPTPEATASRRPCPLATPESSQEPACVRGPVPATLRIDAIGVDAPVEILEVVGGVMQQPTDEVHVAWYKESARLGEIGNLWLAGHLNWWTTPIAVFTDLGLLREGDEVVLLDADGNAHGYVVEWVRQESNLEPPREEVLGMTARPAVTLITCSGEWNSEISEYDARTVVRAVAAEPPGA